MIAKLVIPLVLLVVSALLNIKLFVEYKESASLLSKCEKKYEAMLQSKYNGSAKTEKARVEALIQEHRADYQLVTPAAIAGDDCGSARIRIDNWLDERKKAKE